MCKILFLSSRSKIVEKKEDFYVNVYPHAETTQDRIIRQKKTLEHSLFEVGLFKGKLISYVCNKQYSLNVKCKYLRSLVLN